MFVPVLIVEFRQQRVRPNVYPTPSYGNAGVTEIPLQGAVSDMNISNFRYN